jgi:hypothetical protein
VNIERLSPDRTISYIPQFGGERSKAEADARYQPVVFHLLPMSVTQYELSGELVRGEDGEGMCYRIRPDIERDIIVSHVKKIENLSFADGRVIGDGESFAAARDEASGALAPLYLEVIAAVRDISVLREGERKN